jgi:hypothetical protein
MPAGRPLEPAGDGRPRWMTAGRDAARRPVHRIRLTGQLIRPNPASSVKVTRSSGVAVHGKSSTMRPQVNREGMRETLRRLKFELELGIKS